MIEKPRYELFDKDGKVWRTFDRPGDAFYAASLLWPEQEQDPDHTGTGWDVRVRPKKP